MTPVLQSLISDIAIAMFKVASIIKHSSLKAAIENQAVSLTTSPNTDTISCAENLIILGRETGDIKSINASVLLKGLQKLNEELSSSPITAEVDISSMFTELDLSPSIPVATSRIWTGSNTSSRTIGDNEDNKRYGQDKWNRSSSAMPETAGNNDSADVPVNTRPDNKTSPIKPTRPSGVKKTVFNADKVYQYIKTRKEIKLKELKTEFSEVSGRTVRRITENLMKEGKIERIGNPGPTSYYRLIMTPVSVVTPPASIAPNTLVTTPEILLSAPTIEKPITTPVFEEANVTNSEQNQAIINANQAVQETKQWTPAFSPSTPQNTASKPSDSASVIALPGITQA